MLAALICVLLVAVAVIACGRDSPPGTDPATAVGGISQQQVRTVHGYLVNYMQTTVDAYLSFTAVDADYAVGGETNQAAAYEDRFVTALASLEVTGKLP